MREKTSFFLILFIFLFQLNSFVYAQEKIAVEDLICPDCNVIMISLSNVSAKHMSLYGYQRDTTPFLNQWAEKSVVFENAFTQTSWTLPVATSLMTSLYPYTHGVLDHYTDNVLSLNIKTLPEILREHQYQTAAFTGGLDYDKRFGHMRGFDRVKVVSDARRHPALQRNFIDVFDNALIWLKQKKKNRFFLFLHAYDAHCPFNPPKETLGMFSEEQYPRQDFLKGKCLRGYNDSDGEDYKAYYYEKGPHQTVLTQSDVDYLQDLYDEEVLSVDRLLNRFFSQLDRALLEKTIIIIFSDHGEMFGKHGRFGRAGATRGTLYDEVLHIPLLIKFPSNIYGRRNQLVQAIDIMPTLLDVLGVSYQKGHLQGKSLIPVLASNKTINERVYTSTIFGRDVHDAFYVQGESRCESVRDQQWKLIHEVFFKENREGQKDFMEENFELYDLKKDPEEKNNVFYKEDKASKMLLHQLDSWSQETKNFRINNPTTEHIPVDLKKDMQIYGYW